MHGYISITDRCNSRCSMCQFGEEKGTGAADLDPGLLEKLPPLFYCDITGGEPFLHEGLPDIIRILRAKTRRLLIITNGYYTDKIIAAARQFPETAFRVSIDGYDTTHDEIRQIPGSYEKAVATLSGLRQAGIKDLGICMTVQDMNHGDVLGLYDYCRGNHFQFAVTIPHSSFYFGTPPRLEKIEEISETLSRLKQVFLQSSSPKDWARAYYVNGLIGRLNNKERPLPCTCGTDSFFVQPDANVHACNGSAAPRIFGSLRDQSWDEIWKSERAEKIRDEVKECTQQCWMMCNVAPVIWHRPLKVLMWVVREKLGPRGS